MDEKYQEPKGIVSIPIEKIASHINGNEELSGNERLCFVFMVYFLQNHKNIPKQEIIGEFLGVSRQTVSSYIQKLADKGIISETRYSDYERTIENPKGKFIEYDLKIQTVAKYEGTPQTNYTKKVYTCDVCRAKVQNLRNHFRLAHKNDRKAQTIVALRMKKIWNILGKTPEKESPSFKFFRKACTVMNDAAIEDAIKEFQDAEKSPEYKIHNKGAFMNKIIRDICKIHHITI